MKVLNAPVEDSLKVDKNTVDNTGVGIVQFIASQSNGSEAKSSSKQKGVHLKDDTRRASSLQS